MSLQSLPAELLSAIVDELWASDLRACLGVSREFRVRAVPRIFRTVHLRFGTLNANSAATIYASNGAAQTEVEVLEQTWGILEAIETDRDFARAVKEIVVHAQYGRKTAIFERKTLIRAFNFVPHLSRFAWIGRSPPIQQDVIDALQVHCPNLRSLSTGALESWSCEEPLLDLRQFLNLDHLELFGDPEDVAHVVYHGPSPVVAGMASLKRLSIVNSLLSEIPLRVFMNLTHICVQGFSQDLALVLTHVSALRCLQLLNQLSDIFNLLGEAIDQLVNVSSLSLELCNYPAPSPVEMLSSVSCLAPMSSLTRLHLFFPTWVSNSQQLISHSLPELCARLTAFGLEFSFIENPSTLATIGDLLPQSLTALSLTLPWMTHSLDADAFMPLRDKIGSLPRLAFWHQGWGTGTGFHLDAEELAREMPVIRLLVLGSGTPSIWDVLSPLSPDEPPRVERWSRRRVKERCVSDFPPGTEDGEWLVRHTIGHHMDST